jgi:isoaspartyl peptidase/L-asparaginase-like protein (Ntn-hydrolase superfamily)
MQVLVHGGAGGQPDEPESRQAVVDGAAAVAVDAATPQDGVVAAVRRLESCPRFNAGTGSVVQSDGRSRTDAGLMTGDGAVGAACAMPGVEHAIDVAKVIKEETPHVMVAGERAVSLAEASGVATGRDLWTPETRERWDVADPPAEADTREQLSWVRERFGTDAARDHDTVGAVATDGRRLAAATSTGGRWFALAGRVGDVPQVGAGFYATPGAAVSTTGEGEAIARFGLARRVGTAVADGESAQRAADRLLEEFATETGGRAGVIVVGADGRSGTAKNTEAMQTAGESGENPDG